MYSHSAIRFKRVAISIIVSAGMLMLLQGVCLGVATRRIAFGLSQPLFATAPPGDTGRLFIVEKATGRIKILNLVTEEILATPFIEISDIVTVNEQGLLGLAFDPNYAGNGYFYVNLTVSPTGATEIRRYQVSDTDENVADLGSELLLLTFAQPQVNHNGGWMDFGPDGYLYIATGDGGGSNDDDAGHTPGLGNGQDITGNLLGKMLRIDVHGDDFPGDPASNYAVPADNPFVGITGDDEIWAYGLRNPWRNSFDRKTGDLYIADVGQGAKEEINFQPASSVGGENYGWRVMEGDLCNFGSDPTPCFDDSFTPPIHVYAHVGAPNGGNSITGGYVYRGPRAALQGTYFFADYISDQIWTFKYDGANKTDFTNRTAEMAPDSGIISAVVSFGEDARGNLYIVDLDGEIFRILPEPVLPGDFNDDGVVNYLDFQWFAGVWLLQGCGHCAGVDANTNTEVDLGDLRAFAMTWLD